MKKIIIILTVFSILTSITSCNEDELLNPENPNQLNAENFWLDQRDAEAGIYSVYSSLQFNGIVGSSATSSFALLSEAGRVANFQRSTTALQFDDALINSTNADILTQWEDLYKIVFRANQVIKNVPGIEMEETAKQEILGEAHFLRGLAMFWTATTFNKGNVPYPLIAPDNLEEARFPIVDRSVVFSQIIEDMLLAQESLRERLNWISEGEEGRATYGAITAILGKIYLYEENFSKAREEFLKVINLGEYSLVDDISENFSEEGEFNSESIFEVQFFANIENGGNFGDGEGAQPNESTLRAFAWARGNGGFGAVFATHFISSLYRNEVIDPDLPINQTPVTVYNEDYDRNLPDDDEANKPHINELPRSMSRRSEASIGYEGDGSLFYARSTREFFIRVFSRAQIRKFANTFTTDREPRNSGINERIIRLADVYLMYAEALIRDQGDAGVDEALTYINMVRQRSGLVTLETLFDGVPIPPILQNTFIDLDVRPLVKELADINVELPDLNAELAVLNGLPELTDEQIERRTEIINRIPMLEARIPIIEARIPEIEPELMAATLTLPSILRIEPQALTANNILRHLFNKERPAEFAWEGRGICWHDLRRRPASIGDATERIQELGNVVYQPVTLDVQNFETFPQFIENSLQDFRFRKVNFNEDDLSYPIPAQEILQNPNLGGGN